MASTAAVLNILVAANTAPASAQLAALSGQLKATDVQAKKTSTGIGAGLSKNAKIGAVGMAAAGVAAIGVAKALTGSVKAASDFESSFAEVRKTVDTNEQGFKNIERGIRNMAKRIPISVHELNNLAGEAGALGIASKDIVRFTEVAAKLGTTTNLSSSEAANTLARLSNIMGTSAKDFKNLASTLVGLGNAGASTEAEIANMALRIAGTGKQVGLSEAQVLGFASALSSVGINAEAGGSAISRAFSLISEAVATGNEDLAKFAEVAGMSVPAFSKLFEKDAAKGLLAFTEGLGKSNNAIKTLADLDINEIRLREALLKAAGASELFREQLGLANKEFRDGKALDEEAQKRYETFASRVQTLKNRFYDLQITVGNGLLPILSEFVGELNLALAELDRGSGKLGTMAIILGTVQKSVYLVGQVFKAAFLTVKYMVEGAAGAIKNFWKVLKGLAALSDAVLRGEWGKAWKAMKGIARNGVQTIGQLFKALLAPARGVFETIKNVVRNNFLNAYNSAADFVNKIIKVINLIPGPDIGKVAKYADSSKGPIGPQKPKPKPKQRGGVLNGGSPTGDSIPAMLERGEYVLNREAVKKIGVSRLNELNFKNAPRFQTGGAVGDAVSKGIGLGRKAIDLIAKGPSAFIELLPKPNIPEPFTGAGPYAIERAKDFIKDKVGKLLASSSSSGVPGYTGPPPDFKQLGSNSWVDSNTLAVGYYLANKFGVGITDGWRPQNAGYGAINSSHKRGTPGNPGALDFAPPSTALQRFAGKHIAGLTENDIHDWGTGLHNHIAFFQRGGLAGRLLRMARGGWVKTGYTVFDDVMGYRGPLRGKAYAELGAPNGGVGYISRLLGINKELPENFPLDVKVKGKTSKLYKRDIGTGQGSSAYSIDIWKSMWPFYGLNQFSKGPAWIRRADGKASTNTGKAEAERKKQEAQAKKSREKKRKRIVERIGAKGFKFKGKEDLEKNARLINTQKERIEIAESLARADFGEQGSETSEAELAEQKKLYQKLFELQKTRVKLIVKAMREVQRRIKEYRRQMQLEKITKTGGAMPGVRGKGKPSWMVPGFRTGLKNASKTNNDLMSQLRDLVGITGVQDARAGKFGKIFGGSLGDTNLTLKNLGVKTADGAADSELASLLREQLTTSQRNLAIAQAQAPIFSQFMPKFHQGGIVQGPMGAERPIMAQAGEGVFTRDQMRAMGAGNITVVIEDGAIDSNRIRVEVDGVLQDKISTVRRSTPNRRYATR